MNLEKSLGIRHHQNCLDAEAWRNLRGYANLLLASQGLPTAPLNDPEADHLFQVAGSLVERSVEKSRLLGQYRSPVDQRIEAFLRQQFADLPGGAQARLPVATLELDRHGVARVLSVPAEGSVYESELLTSYRVRNGVLHNPRSDRRTTQGTFHVCEGGLPIPGDKLAVPRATYLALLNAAVSPPEEMLELPFTWSRESGVGGREPEGTVGLCPLSPASDITLAGGHIAGERDGVRGPERAVWPPHPGPLIWKDQSRGELLEFSTGHWGGGSQVMVVGSWGGEWRRRMGHRHSEMRGLDTAVQGFVFEKRASVSQRAWSQPKL